MKTSTMVVIVLVLLIIFGGWWLFFKTAPTAAMSAAVDTSTDTTTTQTTSDTSAPTAPMSATVTYTDAGFSPATVTVAKGGSITFINQSSHRMWVASDPHPTHEGYDGTTRSQHCPASYTGAKPFDECSAAQAGGSFTFTFNQSGSWGYHNHAVDEDKGTIIVQ